MALDFLDRIVRMLRRVWIWYRFTRKDEYVSPNNESIRRLS